MPLKLGEKEKGVRSVEAAFLGVISGRGREREGGRGRQEMTPNYPLVLQYSMYNCFRLGVLLGIQC